MTSERAKTRRAFAVHDRELLTLPELARRSGLPLRKLRRLVVDGDLPAYAAGSGRRRILWTDFLAWLRTTRVRPPSRAAAAHVERRVAAVLAREGSAAARSFT